MKFGKAMLLAGLIFLIAFEASAWNLDNLTKVIPGKNKSVEKPAWQNEKLITCDVCDSITYDNVTSFLKAYNLEEQKQRASAKDEAKGRELMQSYTMASLLINRSQLCMAQALKLKKVTENLLKEKEILLSGTSLSKKEIKKHREYSKEAGQEIIDATKKTGKLTQEQRKNFTFGTATYLTGTYMTQKTVKDAHKYLNTVSDKTQKDIKAAKDGNITTILKNGVNSMPFSSAATAANTVNDLSSGIDDHMLNLAATSKSIYKYSKQQKLDLPADATQYVTF